MLTIDEPRCVHRLAAVADCRACADACPTAAWRLQPDGLDFDPARCDGCGLCVPACPPGALALTAPLALPLAGDGLAIACEHAPAAPATHARVPCLHAVSEASLLGLHRAGLRRLAVASGDCRTCPRRDAHPLAARLDAVNKALRAAGAPTIEALATPAAGEAVSIRRRGFMRLLHPATRVERPDTRRAALAHLGAAGSRDGLWAVSLDAARCTGCVACARLCPEKAIEWLEAGPYSALRLRMDRCTGCNLCVDACDEEALRPALPAGDPPPVFFDQLACAACGTSFRHPASSPASRHCPACRSGFRRPDRLVVD